MMKGFGFQDAWFHLADFDRVSQKPITKTVEMDVYVFVISRGT
jgi:hypothetical protein